MLYKCIKCGNRYTQELKNCPICNGIICVDDGDADSSMNNCKKGSLEDYTLNSRWNNYEEIEENNVKSKSNKIVYIISSILILVAVVIVTLFIKFQHNKNIAVQNAELLEQQVQADNTVDIKEENNIIETKDDKAVITDGYVTDYITMYTVTDVSTGEEFNCKCKITGNLIEGKLNGEGRLENLETGLSYTGEFLNGKYTGIGTLMYENGTNSRFQFENGKIKDNTLSTILFMDSSITDYNSLRIGNKSIDFMIKNEDKIEKNLSGYYTKNEFNIREIDKNGYSLEGNTYRLPDLVIVQISTDVILNEKKTTDIIALDEDYNVYRLICNGTMPDIYEKDVIRADALYISPIGWENTGGGYTNSNLFVILDYNEVQY